MPKGDVPGEWYSPTQPFPVKPPAVARVSFKKEEMVTAEDTTPEHAQASQSRSSGTRAVGFIMPVRFYSLPLFHEGGAPAKSSPLIQRSRAGPAARVGAWGLR